MNQQKIGIRWLGAIGCLGSSSASAGSKQSDACIGNIDGTVVAINAFLIQITEMKEKAYEMFLKYINTHSLMSKNAAKRCVFLEIEGRVEELNNVQGMEHRIVELQGLKEMVLDI